MPMAAFNAYMSGLPRRMAELKLTLAEVVSLPHMKSDDRSAVLRRWKDDARLVDRTPAATPGILSLMGIGVTHE